MGQLHHLKTLKSLYSFLGGGGGARDQVFLPSYFFFLGKC